MSVLSCSYDQYKRTNARDLSFEPSNPSREVIKCTLLTTSQALAAISHWIIFIDSQNVFRAHDRFPSLPKQAMIGMS